MGLVGKWMGGWGRWVGLIGKRVDERTLFVCNSGWV